MHAEYCKKITVPCPSLLLHLKHHVIDPRTHFQNRYNMFSTDKRACKGRVIGLEVYSDLFLIFI